MSTNPSIRANNTTSLVATVGGAVGVVGSVPVGSVVTASAFLAAANDLVPVSGIRNEMAIQKLDTTYLEFAIFSPLDSQGVDFARWLSMGDRTNAEMDAPDLGTATLARLYATQSIPRFGATGSAGITAATATATQLSSSGEVTFEGAWSTATAGGVTGEYTTDPDESMTYTVTVPENGRITIESPSVYSQSAVHKVVCRKAGVEISAANYTLFEVNGDRICDQRQPGSALGVYTVAKDLSAGTYTVELSFVGGVNADVKRLYVKQCKAWNPVAFNAVGVHGCVTANSDSGVLSDRAMQPGVIIVYQFTDATRVDWNYWGTTLAGTVAFSVYDSVGNEIAEYDSTGVDMSAKSGLTVHKVASGLPKGTYYLHVETLNTNYYKPRMYSSGALAYDETSPGAITDTFDILDIPLRPTGGSDLGTYNIIGPGALDAAFRVRLPSEASSAANWVGSVHGNETTITNSNLTVKVDGVEIDWAGAAQYAMFYGSSITLEFSTEMFVPSSDNTTPFGTLTRVVEYLPGGLVKHHMTRAHTLDMYCEIDYCAAMLQVSNVNTGTNYSDSVGGGFTDLDTEQDGSFVFGVGTDVSTTLPSFNRDLRFKNGEYITIASIDDPLPLAAQYEALGATIAGRVLNYSTGRVKAYTEAAEFTLPAGSSFVFEKTFRVLPGA